MKKCIQCLLPETHESISFDESGLCSICQNAEYRDSSIDWDQKKRDLLELVSKFKGKYDYDCIVPFSGGKDSTFTLYYVVRELGLKPLVVSFDHGFYRPVTLENREKIVEDLGCDFINFKPNWKVVRRIMLQSLIERGDFCWHCHTGVFAYPMWVAIEKKVPLVFWGEPSSEYTSYYSYADEEKVDEDRFQITNLGISASDMIGLIDGDLDERDFKPYTYPPREALSELGVVSLPLGSFIPWDTRKQSDLIMSELGWQGDEVENVPPTFPYEKIECYMQGVRDYIKYLKRGYTRPSHLGSIEIRRNRMTREEGQLLVEEYEGSRPPSLDLFLEYVGISEEEFEGIVEKHVVSPWEGKTFVRLGKKPHDYDVWRRKVGIGRAESNEILRSNGCVVSSI